MKIGIRKINIKNRIKSRTTAKLKRKVKKAFIPWYGKKGMGWINNPHKALYNKIYNKTTISAEDTFKLFVEGNKLNKDEFKTFYSFCDKKTRKQLNKELNKFNKELLKKEFIELKVVTEEFNIKRKQLLNTIKEKTPNKYYKNIIGFKFIGYTLVGLILSFINPIPFGAIFFLTIPPILIVIMIKYIKINKKYKR